MWALDGTWFGLRCLHPGCDAEGSARVICQGAIVRGQFQVTLLDAWCNAHLPNIGNEETP